MAHHRIIRPVAACLLLALLASCGGNRSGNVEATKVYFPDGTFMVVSMRPNDALSSKPYKDIFIDGIKDFSLPDEFKSDTGIEMGLLEQVTMAFKSLEPDGMLVIAATTRDVTRSDVEAFEPFEPMAFESKRFGKHLAYVTTTRKDDVDRKGAFRPDPVGYCVVNPRLVVMGREALLKDVLEREKDPVLTPGLSGALKSADFSKPLAFAVDLASLDPAVKKKMEANSPLPFLGMIKTVGGKVALDNALDIRAVATCTDAKTATDLCKAIEGYVVEARQKEGLLPEAGQLLDTLKLSESGDSVTATVSIPSSVITDAVVAARNKAKQMQAATKARGIVMGAVNYAPGNNDKFPPDLGVMAKNNYFTVEWTISPFDSKKVPEGMENWTPDKMAEWVNENSSYFYIPNAPSDTDSEMIAVFERLHTPGMTHVAVGFRDVRAVSMPVAEASKLIKAQLGKSLEELSKLPRPGAGGK